MLMLFLPADIYIGLLYKLFIRMKLFKLGILCLMVHATMKEVPTIVGYLNFHSFYIGQNWW